MMKFTKTNMAKRMLSIVALMLLLATVLTGCGGCGSKEATLAVSLPEADQLTVATENEGGIAPTLTVIELQDLAAMLQSAYSADFNSQTILVAAYRGYNLLHLEQTPQKLVDAGYPDIKSVEGMDLLKVLQEELIAGSLGEEAGKVTAYFAALDPAKDYNRAAIDELIMTANGKAKDQAENGVLEKRKTLNITDLRVLVNAFQTAPDMTIDPGFWDTILIGVGKVLNFLTAYLGFGNYLVGICIFAIIIEAFMLPFAIKQQKNSIKQAKLRPKEMAIRNKYKNRNDQASMQKMQAEIQEFYQRENFSPYSGCLQLLIQMPIIIALYNIVIDPLRYVLGQATGLASVLTTFATTSQAAGGLGLSMSASNGSIGILSALRGQNMAGLENFALFSNGGDILKAYNDMGTVPNFNMFGVNFGGVPSFSTPSILLLVPVLTFAVYFISSKVSRKLMNTQPQASSEAERKQMACSNVMMDIMMPALSTYFTFIVPSLIGVYWIFRCLLNMLKQFIMSKAMPLPVFTEEDYKAAAREMAGKRPVVKKSSNVGKVRSLHHIDDEDFEDTRDRALARKAAIEEAERVKQEILEKNAKVAPAPIKTDADKKKKKNKNKVERVEEQKVELPRSAILDETASAMPSAPAEETVAEPSEPIAENDIEKKDGE